MPNSDAAAMIAMPLDTTNSLADAKAELVRVAARAKEVDDAYRRLATFEETVTRLKAEIAECDRQHAANMVAWATTGEGDKPQNSAREALIEELARAEVDRVAARQAIEQVHATSQEAQAHVAAARAKLRSAATTLLIEEFDEQLGDIERAARSYVASCTHAAALPEMLRRHAEQRRITGNEAERTELMALANALDQRIVAKLIPSRPLAKEVYALVPEWERRFAELMR
jgi:hypothetical protein